MSLGALLLVAALAATPMTGDLGGFMERSSEADFSGEQLVSCHTPDGERTSVFEVAQVDGTVMAWVTTADAPIVTMAPGRSATISDGQVEVTAIEGTSPGSSEVYRVGDQNDVSYLGRDAFEVSLLRDEIERVRLTVDRSTEVVVRTRTFDDQGALYCDRRLVSFETTTDVIPAAVADVDAEPTPPLEDPDIQTPETISGFQLLDTYALDDGTLSYYSDGFFSVGVVSTSRALLAAEQDVVVVESARGEYQRNYQAGSVTVTWETQVGNMGVIGDLPPDLLERFLQELPRPAQRGFFGRIWSRLFG